MKRFLPFLIVALVGLITFGGGFALYRSKKASAPATPKDAPAAGIHVRGSTGAALVTIEEFGDFQCPPCSLMAEALKKIETDYGSRLKMIFHHFPLPMHAHARAAAIAAEAADKQGRFWEMHDLLYKEQGTWSKAPEGPSSLFNSYAGTIGLDMERFNKDLLDPTVVARVEADHELGASRGVTSTPTLFVNGVALKPDATNPQGVHKAIDDALKKEPKP